MYLSSIALVLWHCTDVAGLAIRVCMGPTYRDGRHPYVCHVLCKEQLLGHSGTWVNMGHQGVRAAIKECYQTLCDHSVVMCIRIHKSR